MAQEIADSTLLDTWSSGGNIVEPDISKIIEGWQLGEQPPHEYMNWLQNTFGSKLNHILKNGVASWNDETQYLAGSSVQHNGNVWLCKTTNTNSVPTDVNSNWKRIITVESLADLSDNYVATTGNQTIDGIKTFTSSPIVPAPTTGTQAVNKDYVDSSIGSTPTITGTATFDGLTQKITMTNIGNITLAIGDVIEVTGTTSNNKLFTVESIVDNNNIVVNYEHRGTSTPIPSKRLINETSSNCAIKLYNRAKDASLGQGQGWVDMTALRVSGNNYTNNMGRSIMFQLRYDQSSNSTVKIDNIVFLGGATPVNVAGAITYTVPDKAIYSYTYSGASEAKRIYELR